MRPHGLRAQLSALTGLAVALAVAALALFSRHAVNTEYKRLLVRAPATGLAAVADSLAAPPPDADALLARLAPATGHALVVLDSTGAVRAASAAPLRTARMAWAAAGVLRVRGAAGWEVELHRPEEVALAGGARLVALPAGAGERPAAVQGPPFLRVVDQRLLAGAGLALALGLGLAWLVGGRIARPIERLARAAQRVAAGDLAARVPVEGGDELARLARDFNAMAGALAEQAERRQRLTADVAHELRTPLGHLRGRLEAMQDGLLPTDAAALAAVHAEVLHLARLVEDLEQLAAADEGRLALALADVPAAEAMRAAVAPFAGALAASHVAVRVDVDPDLRVRADRRRLEQILRNLVENALAHSPAGATIELTATPVGGGRVRFTVRDAGDGIAPAHQARVFERFYRVDPARSRATGGSGLGLAIVKNLVQAQGGTVALFSAPGEGTRVEFTLDAPRKDPP